jgi:hypothetical protein
MTAIVVVNSTPRYLFTDTNQVLDTATSQTTHLNSSAELYATPPHSTFSETLPSKVIAKPAKKPWIPIQGGECQFKCCHRCRPSLVERAFLSINGVVNGDVPMTAITGFGFHLQKFRPVAKKEIVEKLGLKQNTKPVGSFEFTLSQQLQIKFETPSVVI